MSQFVQGSKKYQVAFRLQYEQGESNQSNKWCLYISHDGVSYDLVHAFKYFHHAKARLLKMFAEYEFFSYVILDKDGSAIEQQDKGQMTVSPEYRLKHGLLKQKIRIIKREYCDGSFGVFRFCYETNNNGKSYYLVEEQKCHSQTEVHAQIMFNEFISQAPSCEFLVDKEIKGELELNFQVLDQGELFNESETIWFCVGRTDVADNGNAKSDVVGNVQQATPLSNTGGLNTKEQAGTEIVSSNPPYWLFGDIEADLAKLQISEQYAQQVMEHGQLKTIMLRRGLNSPAFIDTISFTVQESAFRDLDDDLKQKSSFDCVMAAIIQVSQCMGFKPVLEISGRNGYTNGLQFGDKEQQRNFGFVCWGGANQQETIMFHFTGEGLSYARQDWEKLLFMLLKKCGHLAKITRIDISHDFLHGQYNIEQAVLDWKADKFTVRQTKPQAEMQGTDWLSGTKKGRTFYIGSKKSSRILYFYEKGKQLGDEESEWLRLELRQRNKDYIIPFDVLLYAGDYLCTAYPHLAQILSYDFSEQNRFQRVKKANGVAIEHVIKYAKMQVSPAIQMLKTLGMDSEEMVKALFNDKAKLPKRLILSNPNEFIEEDN